MTTWKESWGEARSRVENESRELFTSLQRELRVENEIFTSLQPEVGVENESNRALRVTTARSRCIKRKYRALYVPARIQCRKRE